ncbi:efflux RND transporter periplasmic adaptor subunit [Azohydromonas lata]|uniref:Efflux RND transporter periplasmic adaptor subunit n=1 Tax=Azohydromonas lata TaxID=45677 RepID=A0ABU5IP46_9BURK|nr:efflux RND transporter periplasmic adaptor subunit [Azohydromonas lata]MDZ5460662.1 efflux RND transporter periplasmic adaptor subunit [Azohydromonas lata]
MKFKLTATCQSLAGAFLVAAALAGCGKHEAPAAEPLPVVADGVVVFPGEQDPPGLRIVSVEADTHRALTVPGRMGWDEDRTVRVWSPFAGRIERLRATVSQAVKRGDALADVASGDVGQAQADDQKAQADLRLAQGAVQRARELGTAGIMSAKDVQQAEADLARGQAEAGRAHARLAQYGVAAQSVNQSLTLSAPLGGVVVERNANPGTEVRPDVQGPPLFVISDPTSLWVTLDVDETRLAPFKPGATVALRAAAWPDEQFTAAVVNVGESVDAATRTVKVRARVANPERKLKAEMFVNAVIEQPGAQPQLPADAVFLRGNQTYAFVQQAPGRYERREVQVRSAGPQSVTVLGGLQAGEQVVLGGGLYLNQLMDAAQP